jgi:Bacterial protein of unknown function (DUF948).
MLDRPISWGELISVVLFLLGAALLFYLILAVANLLRVLKNVNRIIEKNKDNIDKTIEGLPKIISNAEKITDSLKKNMESIDKVVDNVGKITSSVKKGVETIQTDILVKAKSIVDIIDAIKKFIEKRKAAPSKKKGTTVYRYKYKKDQEKPDEVEIVTDEKMEGEPYPGYVADYDGEDAATVSDTGTERKADGTDKSAAGSGENAADDSQ